MTVRNVNMTIQLGTSSITPAWNPTQVYKRICSGTNTPRELRDAGIYLDNPYSCTKSNEYKNPIWCSSSPTSSLFLCNTATLGGTPVLANVNTPAYVDVIPQLLERWRASSWNAGVTIGEGRENVRMITNTIGGLRDAYRSLRKGDINGALRRLARVPSSQVVSARKRLDEDDVSGSWLNLVLGWMPLLQDISNAAEYVRLDGRQGVVRSGKSNADLTGWPAGGSIPADNVTVQKNERRRHLKVEVSGPPCEIERLGLTDLPTTAWELLPGSFVVDYVMPIGNLLQSLHAVSAMPVTACCDTTVYQWKAKTLLESGKNYAGLWTRSTAYHVTGGTLLQRTVSGGLPGAWAITEQVPSTIKPVWDLSLRKLATSVALLHQVFFKQDQNYREINFFR